MRANYIVIPAVALLVASLGSRFTDAGIPEWYQSIAKPDWTPPGSVIGAVWTVIYVLTTVSALMMWNLHKPWGSLERGPRFTAVAVLLILNAALNAFWSYLFFVQHLLMASFWEAVLLDLSVIALIILIWPASRLASLLLVPYAAWVAFASYLTWTVASMNA